MEKSKEFCIKNIDYYYSSRDDKYYSNDILTFDIETSSAWLNDGNLIPYSASRPKEFYRDNIPCSLCYLWSFSFNDNYYYGRTLQEFIKLLKKLPSDINFVIYVHNLSFEFAFLLNVLKPKTVFARETYHPIKVIFDEFENIEFRCSYMLTRLSLSEIGKEVGVEKDEPIDYNVIRTPFTILDEKILHYSERDVAVMYAFLTQYRNEYKNVHAIPLTQTGRVRREVRRILTKNKEWMRFVRDSVPSDIHELRFLTHCYYGASVHASYLYSGMVVENVKANDFASSYPFVLCSEKFPCERFELDEYERNTDKAYLLRVKCKNVKVKGYMTYLSSSKCESIKGKYGENYVCDNGKIMSADEIVFCCTGIDFEDFLRVYNVGDYEILDCYSARTDYLPKELILYILKLYGEKTSFKKVLGKEEVYQRAKELINAIYGMLCTALVPDEVTFDIENGWDVVENTKEEVNYKLRHIFDSDNPFKPFLAFQTGIFVTSYAKHNLWSCLFRDDKGQSIDEDCLYMDTDNLKYINDHTFKWFNKQADVKLKKMCSHYNIDFTLTRPQDKDGVEHPLGYFEHEFSAKKFKTLGAKRYLYEDEKGMYLTCSGVAKSAVCCINSFDDFKDGLTFDKDAEGVKNKQLQYIHNESYLSHVVWNKGMYDEYVDKTNKYGICMYNRGYSLTINDQYLLLLSQERRITNVL